MQTFHRNRIATQAGAKVVNVSATLTAEVIVTDEFRKAFAKEYPKAWAKIKNNDEEIAKCILYQFLNPCIPMDVKYRTVVNGTDISGLIWRINLGLKSPFEY